MNVTTKFSPNDYVWIMHKNVPITTGVLVVITYSDIYGTSVSYTFQVGSQQFSIPQEKVFLTKQELLESL